MLDGGVGSELERVGLEPDRDVGELWGTVALLETPHLVEEVHRRFATAGADVITAATWRIDAVADWQPVARQAVELAQRAAPDRAIAFSVWPEPSTPSLLAEVARVASSSGADLVLAETIDPELRLSKLDALVRASDVPVWAAFRWTAAGPPDLRPQGDRVLERHPAPRRRRPLRARGNPDGEHRRRRAAREPPPASAGRRHAPSRTGAHGAAAGRLPESRHLSRPRLGVRPGCCTGRAGGRRRALARRRGAQIVGGCCGATAEHIAAMAEALRS